MSSHLVSVSWCLSWVVPPRRWIDKVGQEAEMRCWGQASPGHCGLSIMEKLSSKRKETEAARILECLCSQLQNSLFSTFYWAQLSFKEKTLKVHFSFFRNKTKTDLPYLCVCVHHVCAGVCRSLRVSVGFPGTGVTSSCENNVLGKCSKSLS